MKEYRLYRSYDSKEIHSQVYGITLPYYATPEEAIEINNTFLKVGAKGSKNNVLLDWLEDFYGGGCNH